MGDVSVIGLLDVMTKTLIKKNNNANMHLEQQMLFFFCSSIEMTEVMWYEHVLDQELWNV